VIYHEQVLRIFADCMGITLSQADEYRRAMSANTDSLERRFRDATARRRDDHTGQRLFSDADIDRIWQALAGFGSFGFCKAHGAAFALPTYQTAWLKTHFAPEFFAGLLTHDPGMYPKRLLLTEAKRLGIPILPLHVNHSDREYRVERHASTLGIRIALSDIRSITHAEIDRIITARPFASVTEFRDIARPSQRLFSALERLGALDELPYSSDEQTSPDALPSAHSEHDRKRTHTRTRMRDEVELLGLDVSEHALEPYAELLSRLGVIHANELITLPNSTEVLVAGIRVATQTPPTRNGKRVVFLSLDDGTGCADVTFFDDAQQQAGPLLFTSSLLLVAGKTRRTGQRGISVLAENAWSLIDIAHEYEHKRAESQELQQLA
jgi:error-prone DNA polymerase